MFAGAVVVQRRRRLARGTQIGGRFLVVRRMRAAEQIGFVEVSLAKKCGRGGHVNRLASVRGRAERDLLAGQLVFLDASIFEKGNGLEWLRRGTDRGERARIAGERQKAAE